MSYRPFDNNASGIMFFGPSASDQAFESSANFTIDTSNGALKLPNNGYLGSQTTYDAIQIASNGDITMSQDLTIAGSLTVNGDLTTLSTTNSVIEDTLLELNTGAASNANDVGLIIERGSTGPNAAFIWDESADKFTLGTTTATGASTGDISVTAGTLVAALEGNASTASALASAQNFSLTGEVTASDVSFNGTGAVSLSASVHKSAITSQAPVTTVDTSNDYLLIYDADADSLKKVNPSNLGTNYSFSVSDGSTSQSILNGDTLTFTDGTNIDVAVSATDTVTISISDAGLNSIASLTTAADKMIYTTASDTYAVTDLSSFARTLLDDTDATAARSTLDVDQAGTDNSTDVTLSAALTDVFSLSTQELSAVDNNADAVVGWDDTEGKLTYLSAADVRAAINVDIAGTDSSTDVTLAGARDYLTISGQEITLGEIDISDDTNLATDGSTITLTGDTLSVISGGIGTTQLAADAVTGAKIADESIDSEHYVDGSIDNAHLASSSVTEVKISRTVATTSDYSSGDPVTADINLIAGGAGGFTVDLPAPVAGKMVIVKKTDSAAGAVTIGQNGSETIDGATSVALYYQYEAMTFVSDGTDWFVI
jgi:hypothetical protein